MTATTENAALRASHQECFACGAANAAGLRLRFQPGADGGVAAIWEPAPAFRSYPDRVHGGVLATLVDSAIVHALFAHGVAGVTAELNIRYLRSVSAERPVRVTARVDCARHGLFLCSASLEQDEALAVRATAKFMAGPKL